VNHLLAENPIVNAGLLGLIGGLARCAFAFLKALLSKRQIDWTAVGYLVVINALSGTFLAAVLNLSPTISLLAGYASFDLLESARHLFRLSAVRIPIKSSVKKKTLFERAMEYG
jgi:hypothetical protein